MNKIVNITANIPVRSVKPMRYGSYIHEEMSVEDIFKCICGRAIVDEVLSDGTLVRLDFDNYNTDNNPVVEAEVEQKRMTRKEAKAAARENAKAENVVIDAPVDDAADTTLNLVDEVKVTDEPEPDSNENTPEY